MLVMIVASAFVKQEPIKSQTPAEKAAEEKESARVSSAATFAVMLKRSMRDPDSFNLNSVLIIDKTGAICYEYRARNGFNGLNVGQAVLSPRGTFKTSEMSGFSPIWNKECAHKTGTEEVQAVSFLLEHMPSR